MSDVRDTKGKTTNADRSAETPTAKPSTSAAARLKQKVGDRKKKRVEKK